MAQQNDRYTKIYVAGLPWITRTECLRSYFEQFGEIVYANVVCDRATQRSKGFGFGTFKEVDSATRACENPNHMIDGRTTNCKLAYRGARVPNNQPIQYGQPVFMYCPYNQRSYVCYPCIRIKRNLNLRHGASCSVGMHPRSELGLII